MPGFDMCLKYLSIRALLEEYIHFYGDMAIPNNRPVYAQPTICLSDHCLLCLLRTPTVVSQSDNHDDVYSIADTTIWPMGCEAKVHINIVQYLSKKPNNLDIESLRRNKAS